MLGVLKLTIVFLWEVTLIKTEIHIKTLSFTHLLSQSLSLSLSLSLLHTHTHTHKMWKCACSQPHDFLQWPTEHTLFKFSSNSISMNWTFCFGFQGRKYFNILWVLSVLFVDQSFFRYKMVKRYNCLRDWIVWTSYSIKDSFLYISLEYFN